MSKDRDIQADYKAALIAEHNAYVASGETERADGVADELRKIGHNVTSVETKVVDAPVERAVEDASKRRPVRPVKAATSE